MTHSLAELRLVHSARKHAMRPLTDLGNAERLIDRHGDDLRYCADVGRLVYDGKRWALDKTKEWERRAAATVRDLYAACAGIEDDNVRKATAKWARESESSGRLKAAASVAESLSGIAILPERLDADPFAFNVENGTIDLRTGALSPHDPNDLITKIASVIYDPEAECPLFKAFLKQIFNNDEPLIAFLQRFIGYCLTADVREQVLLFCHGGGQNGKSTFIDTIVTMIGDYAQPAPPGLLIEKRNESHPTDVADLRGARFVTSVEVGDGKKIDEERVKALTGGDKLKARKMREDFFTFAPTHKLLMCANHKPVVKGTDHAIWRRILLVPFLVTITEEQKDPLLTVKLRAELPGILRWAVDGCLLWQTDGLRPPSVVTEATKEYRADQDAIGRFIEDKCFLDAAVWTASAELYEGYREWCRSNGEHDMSQRKFSETLSERGYKSEKKNQGTRGWAGIGFAGRQPKPDPRTGERPDEEDESWRWQ